MIYFIVPFVFIKKLPKLNAIAFLVDFELLKNILQLILRRSKPDKNFHADLGWLPRKNAASSIAHFINGSHSSENSFFMYTNLTIFLTRK